MDYFIGLDGGGTKTKCVLTNNELKIIASQTGGATNPLTTGFDESAKVLVYLIKQVYKKIKSRSRVYICAGIAGCGRKSHANKLKNILKIRLRNSGIVFQNLEIVGDAETAIEGALCGKPGALLIAGTGSILVGKDIYGNFHIIGGYGKLIGDEGGGYSISRKGLNAVSKYYDDRGKESLLVKYLTEKFRINNRGELIAKVYSKSFSVSDVTPLVLLAAKNNDRICREILDGEINELVLHVKAMKQYFPSNNILISFAGSLLINKNYFSTELRRRLVQNTKIVKAKYPPEIGAVIIAKKMLNI